MLFMVTFSLTHRDYDERVSRFLSNGAPPPDGVDLRGRWFNAVHSKGYMLVETDDPKGLYRYASEWASLIDFEVDPVVTDQDAAAVLASMKK